MSDTARISLASEGISLSGTQQSIEVSHLFFTYPLPRGAVPAPRWQHTATVVAGSQVYIFGGIGHALMDDVACLDTTSCTWMAVQTNASSSLDRPERTMGHAAAALGSTIWIFGGQQGRKYLCKLYSLDTATMTWKRCTPAVMPTARAGAAMVTVNNVQIFLFGGQGKHYHNDLYSFTGDGNFHLVQARGKAPSPRRGHSMVWDGGDLLIVFGGTTSSGPDSALHTFSLSGQTWSTPLAAGTPPSGRMHHTAALVAPHTMLVFGGCTSGGTFLNDVYLLDTRTFTWHKPNLLNAPPAPRYHHSCCVIDGRCIIYGGINSKQTLFEGLAVIESRFNTDVAHIAEELRAMTLGFQTGAISNIGSSFHGSQRSNNSEVGSSVHSSVHSRSSALTAPSAGLGGAMLGMVPVATLNALLPVSSSSPRQSAGGASSAQSVPPAAAPAPSAAAGSGATRAVTFVTPLAAGSGEQSGGSSREPLATLSTASAPAFLMQHQSASLAPDTVLATASLSSTLDTPSTPCSAASHATNATLLAPPGPGAVPLSAPPGPGATTAAAAAGLPASYRSAPLHPTSAEAAAAAAASPGAHSGADAGGIPDLAAMAAARSSAPASSSGPRSGGMTSTGDGRVEALTLQLTDLLMKRSMEELHLQASRRAEATEAALSHERSTVEALRADLAQTKLMLAECEAQRASWEARAKDASGRLQREMAAAAEATARAQSLGAQLSERDAALGESRAVQQGLAKELGLLSSRFAKLQHRYDALHRGSGYHTDGTSTSVRTSRSSRNSIASTSSTTTSDFAPSAHNVINGRLVPIIETGSADDGYSEGSGLPETTRSSAPPTLSRASLAAHSSGGGAGGIGGAGGAPVLLAAAEQLLAIEEQLAAGGISGADAASTSASASAMPAAAAAGGVATSITAIAGSPGESPGSSSGAAAAQQAEEAAGKLRAQLNEAYAQLAEAKSRLQALQARLQELEADPSALSRMRLQELRQLEVRLEAAARTVRDAVVARAVDEAARKQRRAAVEQASCGVCLEAPKGVVFGCGHQCCEGCSSRLEACPWCRVPIGARIKLFDA